MYMTLFEHNKKILGIIIICVWSVTACTANNTYSKKSTVKTSNTGMTIYTFDNDIAGSGSSSCNGGCIALWPPVPVEHGTLSGEYSSIMRQDGTMQLTYKNKPLYYYVKDSKPGDAKGDKVDNVWHVIPADYVKSSRDGYSTKSWGYGDNYSY